VGYSGSAPFLAVFLVGNNPVFPLLSIWNQDRFL
jgi:hypothetical protein